MPSTKGRKLKMRNRLWVTRKRAGLRQKQLARLLNHRTSDQVSRYERGTRVPTLRVALQLEIALQTPLRFLFPELYEQLRADIVAKMKSNPQSVAKYSEAPLPEEIGESCSYAERFAKPRLSEAEQTKVRAHVTRLAKSLAHL